MAWPHSPRHISVDQLDEPRLQAFHAYWASRCGDGGAPPRSAINPTDMPRETLPHVLLTERLDEDGRTRFRYRLVGSAVAEAAGRDPTWEYLDETLSPENGYRDYILDLYAMVMRGMRPLYSVSAYLSGDGTDQSARRTRRLMLPLAEDGRLTHVLSVQLFENVQGVLHKPFLTADTFESSDLALIDPA